MDWFFTPQSQNPTQVVTLEEAKSVLRLTDDAQDRKIQTLIDSAIDYFERNTGFLLRAGVLKLNFSYKNLANYNRRSRKGYIANFDNIVVPIAGRGLNSSLGDDSQNYRANLCAQVVAQRPSAFSFLTPTGVVEQLSDDELQNLLGDDFFLPVRKSPLLFRLKDYSKLRDQKSFSPVTAENIELSVNITAPNTGKDIENCIIRMVSMLFENPDSAVHFEEDSLIRNILSRYNCRAGL